MKASALLAAVIAAQVCLSLHAASSRKNALEITYMPTPSFPLELTRRGVLDGEVEAIVSISPDGRIADWLVTASTDPAFERIAAEFLPEIECRLPGSDRRKGPVRVALRFQFEARGVVVSQTINDTLDNIMNRFSARRRTDKLSTSRQLDRTLTAQHTVAPFYPDDLHQATGARVTLDFLIDQNGRVRMPVLHAGENQLLADAATTALLNWQFSPPTRDGQPVIVAARQEFVLPPR